MNKKKIYFLIIAITVLFSCKRYGNDPLTLRTPLNRITGTWEMTKYEIDGVDSLQYLKFKGNNKCEFKRKKDEIFIYNTNYKYTWSFSKYKSRITSTYPFFSIDYYIDTIIGSDTLFLTSNDINISTEWDIKKLTNKDLVLELNNFYSYVSPVATRLDSLQQSIRLSYKKIK